MTSLQPVSRTPVMSDDRLPERVSKVVRDQQEASERLIGWFQFSIVSLFSLLYAASPKAFPPEVEFTPVPWVLAIYILFTLLRLGLAYRGRIPDAILYFSVVIDLCLLLGLIWSFHIQYMQPPTFYLKSPTLLYVFIFIALRALRFEARFVVAAGLVAAFGWTLLAGYAMYASGGMEMVTRDYVYYMTTNSILIGAELDKIVSILTVTAIIAVAITRARTLLVRSVAERSAAQDLSRFFSLEIARQITAAEQELTAGHGQARDAAILFCDIRGFTGFATTVEPDELIATLTEYQHLMVEVIQNNGGAVDKFMGDGIMATFGAAIVSETYAADALRTADEIIQVSLRWYQSREDAGKPPLAVGAAVTTGRVIFGAVGDETRLEFTVIGDAANRAAKFEKHTKTEKVRALADVATYEVASAQGYKPAREPERRAQRMIEGLDGPTDLVVLAP